MTGGFQLDTESMIFGTPAVGTADTEGQKNELFMKYSNLQSLRVSNAD